MSNTVTELTDWPITVNGFGPVKARLVTIGDTNTDCTLLQADDADNALFLVGLLLSETSAANLSFKQQTNYVTPELAANQGIQDSIDGGIIFCWPPGEDAIIKSSAGITSAQFLFVEAPVQHVGRKP